MALLLLGAAGCENINWPFHHPRPDAGPAASGSDSASECAGLLSDIRRAREMRREAPTTSTNPDIVSAAQGKADKQIDDLQRHYDELDCPEADAAANGPGRQPPLQPAPGGR